MPTDIYGGKTIRETIKVKTNNGTMPLITIDISVEVIRFAVITESKIRLAGKLSETIEGTSMIIPDAGYPFRITGIKAKKGDDISYRYEEAGRGYRITVKNARSRPGQYRDMLFITTSHQKRPELRIRVQGDVRGN